MAGGERPAPRDGWKRQPLKYTVEGVVAGDWGSDPMGDASDTVCVRVADFDYLRGQIASETPTIRSVESSRRKTRALQRGDLLLEKSGGGEKQPVGRVVLVDRDMSTPAVASNFIARLRPTHDHEPRFLRYLHRAIYMSGGTLPVIRQTTGIQNLDVERYLATAVWIPAKPEQSRIADFLDTEVARLDQLVRLKERLRSQLPGRTAAAMHDALARLPRDAKLAYAASWRSGGTPPKDDGALWNGELPWASTKDLVRDELADTQDHVTEVAAREHSCVVEAGAVLVATRGMALAKRLPLSITRTRLAFNQDLKALVALPGLEPDYLRIVLRGFEGELLADVVQAAHGTRRLETRHLKGLRLPLPDASKQRAIVAEIREVESQNQEVATRLERQLTLLAERRDALINAAVTGQLDPATYGAEAAPA